MNRRGGLCAVLGVVLVVAGAGGMARAQEQPDSEVAPASSACTQVQGGVATGARFFSTCISNHGNVVQFIQGVAPSGSLGHIPGEEGHFVYFNEGASGFQCLWDAGPVEHGGWTNVSAAPSGANYKVIRRHGTNAWELEQIFGVTESRKIQKIIMIYKNLSAVNHTGVRVGRYVHINAEGTADDDMFLDSSFNTSLVGVDTDPGETGTGISVVPRSWGANPSTFVQTYNDWLISRDDCGPSTFAATPTSPGDWVGWAFYDLATVTASNTKLVVFEYRAV